MFADDCQIYLSFLSNEVALAVEGVSAECSKDADDSYVDNQ
jgi:hypothetical protein